MRAAGNGWGGRVRMASLMTEAQREAFVRRVRLEMAKAGLTRESLSGRAACKERTLGNLLAGQPVRDQTVAKIARVLGIDMEDLISERGIVAPPRGVEGRADEDYGGYLLSAYESYLGTYVAYRRVFSEKKALFRSVYEFDWDEELNRLRFFEIQTFRGAGGKDVTSSHAGGIYISPHTGMLQLLTTFQGALRLATLNKFRMGDNKLCGVILTQRDREVFFQPAVSAIFLEQLKGRRKNSELERMVGVVGPGDPEFVAASAELDRIEQGPVIFAGFQPGPRNGAA
jgi:transcriptional regulator with XRE-family HTH domain